MKRSPLLLLGLLGTVICVPGKAGKSATGLSILPPNAQGPVSAALGKEDSDYWVRTTSGAGFHAENAQQALVAEFTREGTEVRSHSLRWTLETLRFGYGDALYPLAAVAPSANANRVEYRRDGLTEWYENGPLGLEQGFTLARPPREGNGPLTLELRLTGDLVPALESGGKGLELRRNGGEAALRYAGLEARDATGRSLRSWLELQGPRLLLRVEDNGAQYPVVVDPWLQQAELTASDGKAFDHFGWSVAVSGGTAVVGAPYHTVGSHSSQGAAYVFVESGETWVQLTKLTASDGAANDRFGMSVAVSGSTVVVGAPYHTVGSNAQEGAAYVFIESGGRWSEQAELTASDHPYEAAFGSSVAVSGSTAVVGAPYHTFSASPDQGAAYVFLEASGRWSEQAELTASDGNPGDNLGWSVAVSGSTALIGAPYHLVGSNVQQGAAYMFVENGGAWSQQAELTVSNGKTGDFFGGAVAVSGSTAVVGAPEHPYSFGPGPGAAYVFIQSGGTWIEQAMLTASDGVAGDYFGWSVAVSGRSAVVGAPEHPYSPAWNVSGPGAAYVFSESGGKWYWQAELTASGGAPSDQFGYSVAVSDSTAVIGAHNHKVGSNTGHGWAYIFSPPPPVISTSVAPKYGAGQSQAFTATYSDSNGAFDLSEVRMLITAAQSTAFACSVRYVVATGQLQLLDNAGTAWSAGLRPGGGGSASNSQCTLSASGSSVTASGDVLSVVFDISFTNFIGAKNIWLYAADNENQNTGLDLRGTFTAEGSMPSPVTVSVSPQNGYGSYQAFTAVYSDSHGAGDLSEVRMLINNIRSVTDGCYVRYVVATDELELLNNSGSVWSGGITPRGSGSVDNGQCSLYGPGSSVTLSGNTLTVVFDISFESSFEGEKGIWLYAVNKEAQNSGVNFVGTFTVQ